MLSLAIALAFNIILWIVIYVPLRRQAPKPKMPFGAKSLRQFERQVTAGSRLVFPLYCIILTLFAIAYFSSKTTPSYAAHFSVGIFLCLAFFSFLYLIKAKTEESEK